jgi:multiple sugar transport system substrate-binding protein
MKTKLWTSLLGAVALSLLGTGAASAKTQIRFVVAHYSDATAKTFEQAARAFEAANPDIAVQVEDVSWDNLQQRLTTDIAGGTAPDIAIVATRWILDYAQQGIAEPLDAYMTPAFKDQFIAALLAPSNVGGKIWGLPVMASTRALYYNKDLFDRAGLGAAPATWDALKSDAEQVKLKDGGAYGFAIQGKEIETDTYWYYPFWSFGGELIAQGKSGIDSPAGVKAAGLYQNLISQGLTQPSPTGSNREDIENLFKQGRVSMLITGPWLRTQLASEAPKLSYGIAPVPTGTTAATWGGTDSIIMFKSSKVKPEAWKFLTEAVFSPQTRVAFTTSEGFLPVTHGEMDAARIKNDPGLAAFIAMLPHAKFAPQIPGWEQVVDVTSAALQTIYLGEAKPEEALKDAASRIDVLTK